MVEGAGHDALAVGVKVEGHDLRRVPQQGVEALSSLHVEDPEVRKERGSSSEEWRVSKQLPRRMVSSSTNLDKTGYT